MLKNISIRGLTLASALLFAPNLAQARTTQIIAQWIDGHGGLSPSQVFKVQGVFDDHAGEGGYISDGNDVGGGTENFYLYADDERIDQVVGAVIAMQKQKILPEGMRIGVAIYKDAARKNWSFRPVYPTTLKNFDITYSGKS